MQIKSVKFGGTSMGSAASILECADIIKEKSVNHSLIVTVSAVSKITDKLFAIVGLAKKQKPRLVLKAIKEISDIHKTILQSIVGDTEAAEIVWSRDFEPQLEKLQAICYSASLVGDLTAKTIAKVCSYGEKLSSFLMVCALKKIGVKAMRVESESLIKTDSNYICAKVNLKASMTACRKVLKPLLESKIVPVVTGFIGKDTHGNTTLLGRGGSDYTASILAVAFDTHSVEIWTDVNGIMSADPRLVPEAISWDALDMHLMSEMAYSGAKVLHPDTVVLAVSRDIPVYIFNTFDRKFKGTKITTTPALANIKGLVSNPHNLIINLEDTAIINQVGFVANVGEVFKKHNVPIDVCATSEISFTISIKQEDFSKNLNKDLKKIASIKVIKSVTKLCVIGNNIIKDIDLISKIFSLCAISEASLYAVSIGSSGNNITIMVDSSHSVILLCKLHDMLIKK